MRRNHHSSDPSDPSDSSDPLLLWLFIACLAPGRFLGSYLSQAGRWFAHQLSRAWFRLTFAVDCAWCKKRLRHPIIPLRNFRRGDLLIRRISHGICRDCLSAMSHTSHSAH